MLFPLAESLTIITRVKRATPDADGGDVYDPAEVAVTGAFAPEGSTELIQGQDTVITNPTIYLTDGSPTPAATDQIRRELTGEVFNVDGAPAQFFNPFTGDAPGAVVRLERVTG